MRILSLCLLLSASAAHAGTGAPELDPSSLAAGIGLASAVIVLLHDRRSRGARRPGDGDTERP